MSDRELLEVGAKAAGIELHTPDSGPMSFAPFNQFGGYQSCSCGAWHWVQHKPAAEIGKQRDKEGREG